MRRLMLALLPFCALLAVPAPAAAYGPFCPAYWPAARAAGWKARQLPILDAIMWRESRCTPTARSRTRDSGLMQLNDIHLRWLAAHGITQPSLYDPLTNLYAARLLFLSAKRMYGCGWQPWTYSGQVPC